MAKKFALVRWLEEESVGVMPISSAQNPEELYVGCMTKMKWTRGKKLYDVEILKLSESQQQLNKDCDKLANFELCRDDFIKESEIQVSSTDECSPVKIEKPKRKQLCTGKKITPKEERQAKIQSAIAKAELLFSEDDTDSLEYSPVPKKQKLFEAYDDYEAEVVPTEREKQLEKEIRALKKQLRNSRSTLSPVMSVTKNVVSNSTFDSLSKNIQLDKSKKMFPNDQYQSTHVKQDPDETTQNKKATPMKLELVEGYGVYITKRELDDAEDSSRNSPTRLIRNLITIFFPKEVLAASSAYGGRINKALDKDILGACLRYVQSKYAVTKTMLVDAVNDKCANARRK